MLHGIVGGGEAGHGRSSRVANNEVGYGLGPVKTSVAPCNTWQDTSVTGFLSRAPQHMQTHSHGRDVQRSARPSVRRAGCHAWRRRCLRWWEASLLRGAGCALAGGRASRSRRCPAVAVAVAASRQGNSISLFKRFPPMLGKALMMLLYFTAAISTVPTIIPLTMKSLIFTVLLVLSAFSSD